MAVTPPLPSGDTTQLPPTSSSTIDVSSFAVEIRGAAKAGDTGDAGSTTRITATALQADADTTPAADEDILQGNFSALGLENLEKDEVITGRSTNTGNDGVHGHYQNTSTSMMRLTPTTIVTALQGKKVAVITPGTGPSIHPVQKKLIQPASLKELRMPCTQDPPVNGVHSDEIEDIFGHDYVSNYSKKKGEMPSVVGMAVAASMAHSGHPERRFQEKELNRVKEFDYVAQAQILQQQCLAKAAKRYAVTSSTESVSTTNYYGAVTAAVQDSLDHHVQGIGETAKKRPGPTNKTSNRPKKASKTASTKAQAGQSKSSNYIKKERKLACEKEGRSGRGKKVGKTAGARRVLPRPFDKDNDVLMGRGGGGNNNPGNKKWRKFIESHKAAYKAISSGGPKGKGRHTTFAKEKLYEFRNQTGGEYVEYDKEAREFYIVPDEVAIEKTRQALSEKPSTNEADSKPLAGKHKK